ncbi:MAG: hypothetical protein ACI9LM_002297 [Alteromonadaceae bacterium]|jgi:hypothetical protein
MKQSIVFFYLSEIAKYECIVRESLNVKDYNLFSVSTNFMVWWESTHKWVSFHFRGLTLAFLTIFPLILMWKSTKKLALTYLGLIFILSLIYANSASLIIPSKEIPIKVCLAKSKQ